MPSSRSQLDKLKQIGSPDYGEMATQMTVGTPIPAGEEPGLARQGLDLLKQAGKTVYGNLREAVVDPKAFHTRALGNVARQLQTDPQEFIMNWTGGGLGGVIKPKGGVFPKEGSGSKLDTYLERIQEYVPDVDRTKKISEINAITDFIAKKGRKYFTSVYGAPDDPLREALLEGRLPRLGSDKERFREYLMAPAREGTDPIAVQDFEKFYDQALGLTPHIVNRAGDMTTASNLRATASRKMLEQLRAQGVPDEMINARYIEAVTPERMGNEYAPEYLQNLGRKVMNEDIGTNRPIDIEDEVLFRAAREGEVFYDMSSTPLDFLEPRNLARSLSTLDPNKLQNMSFAEAVVQGTKNTKLQREWDEVVKRVRDGKNVDKSVFAIGTERIRPMGDDTWVRINSGQAAELEGAAMRHSVGGYAKKGDYGHGGLEALMSGKAQVFSLRGTDGQPRVTIEALNMGEGKLKVTQIKGRFNGMPDPEDQKRVVEFLKEMPVVSANRERYYKNPMDQELEAPQTVDWAGMLGVRE